MEGDLAAFRRSFESLAAIGRNTSGGYSRLAWTDEDHQARSWFASQAKSLGLDLETDGNGNLWAWWGPQEERFVLLGSHLDTVPNGGAYDGALGLVCSFLAIRQLQQQGQRPKRTVAVVAFSEEEGGRFGVPTFGSRMLTGALDAQSCLERSDNTGVTLEVALTNFGVNPDGLGPDLERLARAVSCVEIHVEQGVDLTTDNTPLGIATYAWPHGRWELAISGEANHAGTTSMEERRDPMKSFVTAVSASTSIATRFGARATIGRIEVTPNNTNTIPSEVRCWLDLRGPEDSTLKSFMGALRRQLETATISHGTRVEIREQSSTPLVEFDAQVKQDLASAAEAREVGSRGIPTAAGHDACAISSRVPTGMLFVRNPTGASHCPSEGASDEDCVAAIGVLANYLSGSKFS